MGLELEIQSVVRISDDDAWSWGIAIVDLDPRAKAGDTVHGVFGTAGVLLEGLDGKIRKEGWIGHTPLQSVDPAVVIAQVDGDIGGCGVAD